VCTGKKNRGCFVTLTGLVASEPVRSAKTGEGRGGDMLQVRVNPTCVPLHHFLLNQLVKAVRAHRVIFYEILIYLFVRTTILLLVE